MKKYENEDLGKKYISKRSNTTIRNGMVNNEIVTTELKIGNEMKINHLL